MSLRIRELIKEIGNKENGLTSISALAERAGLTQASMSNIVNEKASPSLDTLQRIADALNVDISELFKPQSGTIGIIRHNGQSYEINSIEDIKKLLSEIESVKE